VRPLEVLRSVAKPALRALQAWTSQTTLYHHLVYHGRPHVWVSRRMRVVQFLLRLGDRHISGDIHHHLLTAIRVHIFIDMQQIPQCLGTIITTPCDLEFRSHLHLTWTDSAILFHRQVLYLHAGLAAEYRFPRTCRQRADIVA
jgi:hypothetical protein